MHVFALRFHIWSGMITIDGNIDIDAAVSGGILLAESEGG